MAKLHFKYGAMNSGKSDTLIKAAYNYEEQGLRVVTTKSDQDTKGDRLIVARAGLSRETDFLVGPKTDIFKVIEGMGQTSLIHCVMVDEAQFLSAEHVSQLYHVTKELDISAIAYGLKSDFRTKMFEGSMRLLELADNIEKLPTMCGCGSQAEFNTRKLGDEFVFEGSQKAIDGVDGFTYTSLCGHCYMDAGGTI